MRGKKNKKEVSREELIVELQNLGFLLGRIPNLEDCRKENMVHSAAVYLSVFRSWTEALEAAGYVREDKRKRFTKMELLQGLSRLRKELGRNPKSRDVDACEYLPSSAVYNTYFGSFSGAMRMIGYGCTKIARFSDKELLDKLKVLHKRLGRCPRTTDLRNADDMPSPDCYRRAFGDLYEACRRIGIDVVRGARRKFTDDEMFDFLRQAADAVGHTPSAGEYMCWRDNRAGIPAVCTYRQRYHSWLEALRGAGLKLRYVQSLDENDRESIDEELEPPKYAMTDSYLCAKLWAYTQKVGHIPTYGEICPANDMPSYRTYYRRFGNLHNALIAAFVIDEDPTDM